MSITIKKAEANGFTMNYFTFGAGERVFVIIPGLSVQSVMGAADIIAEAYELIGREFTVYVFDRRNELPESYTVYDMAEDTAEIFRVLGLKDVYLFGASQGGMMGLTIAARHPKLVKKLVLGSSAARIGEKQYVEISKWLNLANEKDSVKLSVEMGKALYPESLFEQYKNTLKSIGETVTDEELERFVIFAKGTKGFDITSELSEIECPVFSIGVSDDAVLEGAAEDIEKLMKDKPNFESYMYTGCGHAAFDTAPDYKKHILDFLNK